MQPAAQQPGQKNYDRKGMEWGKRMVRPEGMATMEYRANQAEKDK